MILVNSWLAGMPVRYDGRGNLVAKILQLVQQKMTLLLPKGMEGDV